MSVGPVSASRSSRCSAMMLVGMPIAVSMAVVGIVGGIAAYGVPVHGLDRAGGLGRAEREPADLDPAVRAARRAAAALGHRRPHVHRAVGLARAACPAACCTPTSAAARCSRRPRARRWRPPRPSARWRCLRCSKRGYPMRASLGSLAAGGTLGILIPPSVNMIVYGSLTNNSIGKLFIAGIIPGLLLTGCFMLWICDLQRGQRQRHARGRRCRWPSACARCSVPDPAAGGVRHRDGQPVLRHRHRDRERGAGRDRGAGLRLAVGQAELGAAAHLLHLAPRASAA